MKHTIEVHDQKDYWHLEIYQKRGSAHTSVLIGKTWPAHEIAGALAHLASNLDTFDQKPKRAKRAK